MKYIGYKRKLMFSSKTLGSINNMFAMYDDSIGLVYQLLKISRLCRSFSKNILNCAEASKNIQIVQKLLQKYLDCAEAFLEISRLCRSSRNIRKLLYKYLDCADNSRNIQIVQKLLLRFIDCAVASRNIQIVQKLPEIYIPCRSFQKYIN